MALLDEQIEATIADPRLDERDDILAMLVQAPDEDGNGLGREALINDLILLIGAGHETTAAAIAWALVLLAHDPGVLAEPSRAAREGDDAYLGAVKEVLRFRPPVPAPRSAGCAEPVRDRPASDPGRDDDPDRRLGPPPRPRPLPGAGGVPAAALPRGAPPPYGWLPFGGGAHRCIGAALAELEITVALKRILCLRTIAPVGPALPPPARRGVTIVPHGGGRVTLGALSRGA